MLAKRDYLLLTITKSHNSRVKKYLITCIQKRFKNNIFLKRKIYNFILILGWSCNEEHKPGGFSEHFFMSSLYWRNITKVKAQLIGWSSFRLTQLMQKRWNHFKKGSKLWIQCFSPSTDQSRIWPETRTRSVVWPTMPILPCNSWVVNYEPTEIQR
jgi:hypothetical protein